jgi:tetratricopeptide (TPR) repeat protein
VTGDDRILELRRRVQTDPASLSFAQLAEELRRLGENEEAVGVCRAGLTHHPGNLTARVTLGRALIELGRLEEAFTELTFVLDAAPGNLPAIRALAEIYQRRGMMSEALVHYRRALQLAQHDTDLEHTVHEIQQVVEPQRKTAAARIEELFDFDSLMAQLGGGRGAAPEFVPLKKPPQSPLDEIALANDNQDAFAAMERQLREREERRLLEERQARQAAAERRRQLALQELENWLAAIAHDRRSQPSA